MTWSVAFLDGVDLAVWAMQILYSGLYCFVATSIFEHLQQNFFSRMSKVSMQPKGSPCSFMAMGGAKLSKNSSEGLVIIMYSIDLFVDPFIDEQAMNQSGS